MNKIKESSGEVIKSLKATIAALNKLIPGITFILMLLSALVIIISITSTKLMIGIAILLVLSVSILIYGKTSNYGEAALSLVVGLLTIFSIEWSAGKFIAFATAWVAFTLFVLIISSIRIASRTEDTYRQAAIFLAGDSQDPDLTEKELKKIGEKTPLRMFGPVERAEIIRIMAFRKVSIESIKIFLIAIEQISVITKVDIKTVTSFIIDASKILRNENSLITQQDIDLLYKMIQETPVSPEDFIDAFQRSKSLLLSEYIGKENYFNELQKCLGRSVRPEDMYEVLKST